MKNRFVDTLQKNDFRVNNLLTTTANLLTTTACDKIFSEFSEAIEVVYGVKAEFATIYSTFTKNFHVSPKTRSHKNFLFTINEDYRNIYFCKETYQYNAKTLPEILEKIASHHFFLFSIEKTIKEEKENSMIGFIKISNQEFFNIEKAISPETRQAIFLSKKKEEKITSFSFYVKRKIVYDRNFFIPDNIAIENLTLDVENFIISASDSVPDCHHITITAKFL